MKETIIFDQPQDKIVYGILGDTYIFANEREVEVQEPVMEMGEENMETTAEPRVVTKYEYDVRHFPLANKTEAGVLAALKEQITAELMAFDGGLYAAYGDEAVNDFTINGMHIWLDKETRNGLRLRFDSQKALGQTETTLWYDIVPLPLQIDAASAMLYQLENYASACFDRTASHRQAITALTSIDDVFNYDYKAGYPNHLSF